jgi:Phosphodiester glycosidase/FlgD Ig-like domain
VLRKAAILAAALAAAFPSAATAVELAPGMVYKREVRTIGGARVVVHVLEAPQPGGLYALKPVLSNGTVTGRETVSSMERRISRKSTAAGVNGDLFNWSSGRPSGIFLRSGLLATRASPLRSSLGIGLDGLLRTELIRYEGTWQFGSGRLRRLREFNHPLEADNGVALFSPSWGATTPHARHAREVILAKVARVGPNKDLSGKVVAKAYGSGHVIPAGGAVLQARGDRRSVLAREARLGSWVKLRVALDPWWSGVRDAIGGGPRLVNGGVPVFQAGEQFLSSQLVPRNPRTAVGQLPDGHVLLVAVDGRASWSAGVTNTQLARLMANLGASTAMALDAGGSTTMAFDGRVLNHPSDGQERPVGDALMVLYYGIYAPPPRLALYSPNGDGVADEQRLYTKVVRPSRVTTKLVRSSTGAVRSTSTRDLAVGTYVKTVRSRLADGKWKWVVSAVDSKGRASEMTRIFTVNSTLGNLQLSKTILRPTRDGGRLRISFDLSRSAGVKLTIRRPSGRVVRHLLSATLGPGPYAAYWNVRNDKGRVVRDGTYVVKVKAVNSVGSVALAKRVKVIRRF